MKNHAAGHGRKGGAGYRTPSSFRFTAHDRARTQKAKNLKNPYLKKG